MGGSVGGSATGGTWSGGSGTWTNSTNESTATYTSDASEKGTITLTLTTTGSSVCSAVTDTKTISVLLNTAYVDENGTDSESNGHSTGISAFATLTYAVSKVCAGGTINIAAGTYTDENITIDKDNLTITGAGVTTIFESDNTDERFLTIVADNFSLSNMLIRQYGNFGTGSSPYSQNGGAVRVGHIADGSTTSTTDSYSGISFSEITFQDNLNDQLGGGGAIGFVNTSGTISSTISKCIFKGNRAGETASSTSNWLVGGAISYGSGNSSTIQNCLFYENQARRHGAAISGNIDGGQILNIYNCTFADNISRYNGHRSAAVYVENTENSAGTVNYENNIFYGTTRDGSSTSEDDLATSNSSSYRPTINWSNNIYGSQSELTTSCSSCSTNDPLFSDAANDDYSLASLSPAINSGSSTNAPADDILGVTRANGGTTGIADDIGCYEFNCSSISAGTATGPSQVCAGSTANLTASKCSSNSYQMATKFG